MTTDQRKNAMARASALAAGAVGLMAASPMLMTSDRSLSRVYVSQSSPAQVLGMAPQQFLGGKETHIVEPFGLAVDRSRGVVIVANRAERYANDHHRGGSLVVLPPRGGDVSPLASIHCPAYDFWGVTTDNAGHIVAPEAKSNSVMTFDERASGCVRPMSEIAGSQTGLAHPLAAAIDGQGRIVVDNFNSGIEVFAAGSAGNVKPVASITSSQLEGSEGLALDRAGNIYASSYANGSVVEFSRDANGPSVPLRTIAGPHTMLKNPIGIAVDPRGAIYVADYGAGALLVYAPGASGDAAPQQVTRLSWLTGVAL